MEAFHLTVWSLFLFCQTQCFALSPTAFITVNLRLWGSSVFALQVNTFTRKQHGCMSEPAHAVIRRSGRHLCISCKNLTSTWGKRCRAPWNDLTFPLCVCVFFYTTSQWSCGMVTVLGNLGNLLSLQTARPSSPTCSSSLPTTFNFSHLSRPRKPRESKPKMKKLKYHQYIPPDQRGGSGTGGSNICF